MAQDAEDSRDGEAVEMVCPHCRKRFSASLMAGTAERYRGYKCPHCRLFVPAARVEG